MLADRTCIVVSKIGISAPKEPITSLNRKQRQANQQLQFSGERVVVGEVRSLKTTSEEQVTQF